MTEEPSTDAALAARLEQLRANRAPVADGPGRRRKPHAAPRSRVAAAALGVGVTVGLIATMQAAGLPGTPAAASVAPGAVGAADAPVIVVVHRRTAGTSSGPVVLNANPVVRSVQPQASSAPAARTHGSR